MMSWVFPDIEIDERQNIVHYCPANEQYQYISLDIGPLPKKEVLVYHIMLVSYFSCLLYAFFLHNLV